MKTFFGPARPGAGDMDVRLRVSRASPTVTRLGIYMCERLAVWFAGCPDPAAILATRVTCHPTTNGDLVIRRAVRGGVHLRRHLGGYGIDFNRRSISGLTPGIKVAYTAEPRTAPASFAGAGVKNPPQLEIMIHGAWKDLQRVAPAAAVRARAGAFFGPPLPGNPIDIRFRVSVKYPGWSRLGVFFGRDAMAAANPNQFPRVDCWYDGYDLIFHFGTISGVKYRRYGQGFSADFSRFEFSCLTPGFRAAPACAVDSNRAEYQRLVDGVELVIVVPNARRVLTPAKSVTVVAPPPAPRPRKGRPVVTPRPLGVPVEDSQDAIEIRALRTLFNSALSRPSVTKAPGAKALSLLFNNLCDTVIAAVR